MKNQKQNAPPITKADLEEFILTQPMNATGKDITSKALVFFKGRYPSAPKKLKAFKKRISRAAADVKASLKKKSASDMSEKGA